MKYKFIFTNEEEREDILNSNKHLTHIETSYLLGESYLVFTDEEVVYKLTENEILGNKISILEAENETLKQELSITQDAVNELIFKSLNM